MQLPPKVGKYFIFYVKFEKILFFIPIPVFNSQIKSQTNSV